MSALTRQQVRDIDRRAIEVLGVSSLVLMENAGRGCADVMERLGVHGLVAICCGRGNNGGDGYVIARHLALRGHRVHVLLWDAPERMTADCRANYQIARSLDLPVQTCDPDVNVVLPQAEWYVDALLGTGAQGDPRHPYDRVIRALNEAQGRKLAVDIPSGLDCDTGEPAATTFRADVTVTFAALKVGMLKDSAQPVLGQIHVTDIGVPVG